LLSKEKFEEAYLNIFSGLEASSKINTKNLKAGLYILKIK
jgi:hypothetical protein